MSWESRSDWVLDNVRSEIPGLALKEHLARINDDREEWRKVLNSVSDPQRLHRLRDIDARWMKISNVVDRCIERERDLVTEQDSTNKRLRAQ